jgi:hypothetical protein
MCVNKILSKLGTMGYHIIIIIFFLIQSHHTSILDFVVSLLVVAEVWGWDAHEALLRCPDEVDSDIYEYGVPEGALNLNSTNYPDHGHHGDPPLLEKIPMVEPGIEPGTSWLIVRNADH